ncbi:hypothetical protein JOC27_001346 [Sporolactobacillus spathodeae]|uniref:Uncharacterized protein n=1 Tax=Sporolactobacillus spathodeae TaxID=1465502 RepID=A0ABS2Q8G2_9BACL|nr:hypothetical protein [Sporolactobacillus spathodeae]
MTNKIVQGISRYNQPIELNMEAFTLPFRLFNE